MRFIDGAPARTLPPGPRLPRWLQTSGFLLQPARWIDDNRRRYGDLVTFRTLFDPCFVMVFDPKLVKQVFRGKPDQLRAGEANAVQPPSPSSAHQVEPDDFDGRTRA